MISRIWDEIYLNCFSRIEDCFDLSCDKREQNGFVYVFFRADDVAIPDRYFFRLINLFEKYKFPLSLAVVPSWLTEKRWEAIYGLLRKNKSLWCCHQHGFNHENYEKYGKKQEFGPARLEGEIEKDIINGRKHLESLMGDFFYPCFTPPWNRCDQKTLKILRQHGYYAISRSLKSWPLSCEKLPDLYVSVDLHTRREKNSKKGFERLFAEIDAAVARGFCGIMIHHQYMNEAAFTFLEFLINELSKRKNFKIVNFKDLVSMIKSEML